MRARTSQLDVVRGPADVRVELGYAEGPCVTYSFGSGEMRTCSDERETVARVEGGVVRVAVTDDLRLRMTSSLIEVERGHTAFVLDPDSPKVTFSRPEGRAAVMPGAGFEVTCERSGWRVAVSASTVVIGTDQARLVWDRRTGEVRECGVLGLSVRLADDTIRVRWGTLDLAMTGDRVLVANGDESSDWYVAADGQLVTAGSSVTAGRSLDGIPEVVVQAADHAETVVAWPGGVCVEDGRGLRTAIDASGRLSCTPTARADHAVMAWPDGRVTVTGDARSTELSGYPEAL